MLSTRNSEHQRHAQRDAGDHLADDIEPPFDWTGEFGQRAPGRHAPPVQRVTTAPQREEKPAGILRALAGSQWQALPLAWRGLLGERRWLAVIGAGIAALAIVGGLILFLSGPAAKRLAAAPASTHKASRSHSTPTSATTRHSPAPRTHPTPSPRKQSPSPTSPAPTSTPTAAPNPVKVSYSVVREHPHSFQGQFTIVNNGSTPINGWELVVVLPGDDIRSISDGSFHTNGDTLYIDPAVSQRTIAPGATVTENLAAHGSTTTPTSCTFNGSPC